MKKSSPIPESKPVLSPDIKRLTQMIEHLPTLTYSAELLPKFHLTYISPQLKPILGYDLKEWTDNPNMWREVLHPDDSARIQEEITLHTQTGEPFFLEFRVRTLNGKYVWVYNSASYQRDDSGQPVAIHGIIQDISGPKQAIEALRASEKEYKRLSDFFMRMTNMIPDMIWTKDTEGRYTFANQSICDNLLHAKNTNEPIGKTDLFFAQREIDAHPEDPNWFDFGKLCTESDVRILKTGKVERFSEAGMICGTYTHLEVLKAPLWNDAGKIIGTVGTARDITEQRHAEDALIQSEQRNRILNQFFNNMTDVMADMLWAKDLDFNYTFANRSLCEKILHAGSTEEAIGKNLQFFIDRARAEHPDQPEWYTFGDGSAETDAEVIKAGKTLHFEMSGTIMGKMLYLDLVKTPIKDDDGRIIGLVCSGRDITEQKLLEEKLRQRQKLESVGRLAGGVAHDFNNMLQTIMGNAEMALDMLSPNNPARESLIEIRKASERSANLTRQLLAFGRKQSISPHLLNLNDTIGATMKMLRRIISENIHLQWKASEETHLVKMDPAQIDQILVNLCINSRDAITGGGTISIDTESIYLDEAFCNQNKNCEPGDYVLIRVRDTGSGMTKDVMEHIFEPFFTTKGKFGESTGLGLSTVYGIIQQNNGLITVQSEPDQGTTFQIYLPRFDIDPDDDEQPVENKTEEDRDTILLVEDELSILDLSKRMLSRMGYRVIAVSSPTEALKIAQESDRRISLLVTDVIMPEMNGSTLSEVIQKRHPGIQCLFISGYSDEVLKPHGVFEKGVHFFQKPFTMNALAEKIRMILAP